MKIYQTVKSLFWLLLVVLVVVTGSVWYCGVALPKAVPAEVPADSNTVEAPTVSYLGSADGTSANVTESDPIFANPDQPGLLASRVSPQWQLRYDQCVSALPTWERWSVWIVGIQLVIILLGVVIWILRRILERLVPGRPHVR